MRPPLGAADSGRAHLRKVQVGTLGRSEAFGEKRAPQEVGARVPKTYTVVVTFTVGSDPDEHLRDERAIREEIESWLQSLDASVDSVTVRPADAKEPT